MLAIQSASIVQIGDSYKFLNETFMGNSGKKLSIGDKVYIHPIPGKSQATKSYEAIVVANIINWCKGEYPNTIPCPKIELCVRGINDNKKWHGAVINEYCFMRLEPINYENISS